MQNILTELLNLVEDRDAQDKCVQVVPIKPIVLEVVSVREVRYLGRQCVRILHGAFGALAGDDARHQPAHQLTGKHSKLLQTPKKIILQDYDNS